jgi:hypothetical protein
VQAELRSPDESFPRRAQTTDLSAGGGYFELMQTMGPKRQMDVTLWIGDVKVRAWAEVVTDNPHVGNGIKFVRMAEKDREILKEFIDRVQKNSSAIDRARHQNPRREPTP